MYNVAGIFFQGHMPIIWNVCIPVLLVKILNALSSISSNLIICIYHPSIHISSLSLSLSLSHIYIYWCHIMMLWWFHTLCYCNIITLWWHHTLHYGNITMLHYITITKLHYLIKIWLPNVKHLWSAIKLHRHLQKKKKKKKKKPVWLQNMK